MTAFDNAFYKYVKLVERHTFQYSPDNSGLPYFLNVLIPGLDRLCMLSPPQKYMCIIYNTVEVCIPAASGEINCAVHSPLLGSTLGSV